MTLRLRFFSLAVPFVLSVGTLSGCASTADDPAVQDDSALAAKAPKLGASKVELPANRIPASVAVFDHKLYLGLHETAQVAVVDPATMKVADVIKSVRADASIVRDGHSLVMLGYDANGPQNAQFSFVLSWFDPGAKKVTKEVRVHLDKTIMSEDDQIVQRPTAAFAIGDGTVYFALHQLNGVQKLVTFPVPSAETTVLNDDGELFAHGIEIARAGKGLALTPDGKAVVLGVPQNAKDGYLERVELASGKRSKLGEKLGYPNRVAFVGGKLFVEDYNGALLSLDPTSGKVLHTDDVNEFVSDMAFDGKYVYLVTDEGFFVLAAAG